MHAHGTQHRPIDVGVYVSGGACITKACNVTGFAQPCPDGTDLSFLISAEDLARSCMLSMDLTSSLVSARLRGINMRLFMFSPTLSTRTGTLRGPLVQHIDVAIVLGRVNALHRSGGENLATAARADTQRMLVLCRYATVYSTRFSVVFCALSDCRCAQVCSQ